CPFLVDEMRRHDARSHLLVLKRECTDDLLSFMLESPLIETKRDEFAELRRPGDGRYKAASVTLDLLALGKQDRTATQALVRFKAFDADEAPALWRFELRPLTEFAADIGLGRAGHLAETQVIERIAVVKLEPCDVAFLDPERRQGFEPVGLDAERRRH